MRKYGIISIQATSILNSYKQHLKRLCSNSVLVYFHTQFLIMLLLHQGCWTPGPRARSGLPHCHLAHMAPREFVGKPHRPWLYMLGWAHRVARPDPGIRGQHGALGIWFSQWPNPTPLIWLLGPKVWALLCYIIVIGHACILASILMSFQSVCRMAYKWTGVIWTLLDWTAPMAPHLPSMLLGISCQGFQRSLVCSNWVCRRWSPLHRLKWQRPWDCKCGCILLSHLAHRAVYNSTV